MDRSLALLGIGLLFGGGVGFVAAAGLGATLDGHDHGAGHGTGHGAAAGHGPPLELPAGPGAPSVAVELTPDPVSGWNLNATVTDFRFAPERAGAAAAAGEGHGHVYVDGAKVARLYGPRLHLDHVPAGATVEVTLNANDHRPLAVAGAPVVATVRAID